MFLQTERDYFLRKSLSKYLILRSPTAPGLTFEGNSAKEISLWGLASLSCGSKAKSNSPCNFEESSYVARICLPVPFMKMSFPVTQCLIASPFQTMEPLLFVIEQN
jgi:hypothetical protein